MFVYPKWLVVEADRIGIDHRDHAAMTRLYWHYTVVSA